MHLLQLIPKLDTQLSKNKLFQLMPMLVWKKFNLITLFIVQ